MIYWDVAQLVEQRFLIPLVGGSSPPVPAILIQNPSNAFNIWDIIFSAAPIG